MSDFLSTAHYRIVSIGSRLASMSIILYVFLVTIVAAFKVTVTVRTSDLPEASVQFPKPVNPLSVNVLDNVLLKMISQSSPYFLVASFMFLVMASALLPLMIRNFTGGARNSGRIALIFAVSWPLLLADFSWLGIGNAALPIFVVLFTLGRQWLIVGVGLIGWTLTHPEQAFAGSLSLLLLSFASEFAYWRKRAAVAVVVTGLTFVAGALWLANAGLGGRAGMLPETALVGFTGFLRNDFVGICSWWGLWWLAVIALLIGLRGSSRIWLVSSLVLVPGLFTIITLDGTRVFSSVASASGIAIIATLVRVMCGGVPGAGHSTRSTQPSSHTYLGYLFLALLLLPNVQVMMPGEAIPLPGAYTVGLLENLVYSQ